MTRMFSIGADEMAAGDGVLTDVPDTPDRLRRAKDGVASLDGFGLQPCFEEFWEDFAPRYGLELGEPVRSNRTEPDDGVTGSSSGSPPTTPPISSSTISPNVSTTSGGRSGE